MTRSISRPVYLSELIDALFNDSSKEKRWRVSLPPHPVSSLKFTKDGTAILEIATTGLSKSEVTVDIEDDVLIIKGKKVHKDEEEYEYAWKNIAEREFELSFSLSHKMDLEKITSCMQDGILSIKVPMKEEAKPVKKQIEIK